MTARINKWLLLGPAGAKKTQIVMQCLLKNPVIKQRPFVFVCESGVGCAVDFANQNGIPVVIVSDPRFKTEESREALQLTSAEMLVSCGWNYIIPKTVFERFPYPCLNCHSSLLPDYKGQRAYLHQWANCENEYGVSIHFIDEKFDEGRLLIQGRLQLFLRENLKMMHQRMSELTGALLPQALLLVEDGFGGEHYEPSAISRYFHKITPRRAKVYRFCNRILKRINRPLWLTPHTKKNIS